MNHPGNDVLACAALAVDQDGNIGARHLAEPFTDRLHSVRMAEHYWLGRNFTERLD